MPLSTSRRLMAKAAGTKPEKPCGTDPTYSLYELPFTNSKHMQPCHDLHYKYGKEPYLHREYSAADIRDSTSDVRRALEYRALLEPKSTKNVGIALLTVPKNYYYTYLCEAL